MPIAVGPLSAAIFTSTGSLTSTLVASAAASDAAAVGAFDVAAAGTSDVAADAGASVVAAVTDDEVAFDEPHPASSEQLKTATQSAAIN